MIDQSATFSLTSVAAGGGLAAALAFCAHRNNATLDKIAELSAEIKAIGPAMSARLTVLERLFAAIGNEADGPSAAEGEP